MRSSSYRKLIERGRKREGVQSVGGQRVQRMRADLHLERPREGYRFPGHDIHHQEWLDRYFSDVATAELADFHHEFWDWIDALEEGKPPALHFVGCWFRNAAKSSTAELGITKVTLNLTRRFILYVMETQDQANERIQNIGGFLSSQGVRNAVNDHGHSLGWKANMLRTENGVAILGVGLNVALRGIKLGKFRPDWIVFDDIESREDSPATTAKRLRLITEKIIKAGARHVAVTFLQNLIHEDSIMSQVVNGTADFLLNRNDAKPIAACDDLVLDQEILPSGKKRWRVRSGKPRWAGFNLKQIEDDINLGGLTAFLRESQQQVEVEGGGLWDRERGDIQYWDEDELPELLRVGVAVDPSGSKRGDEVGIVGAGLFRRGNTTFGLVLDDLSEHLEVAEWTRDAVRLYNAIHGDVLVAERNFGGDMVAAAFGTVKGAPPIKLVSVSRGKSIRAEPVQRLYFEGRVYHRKRMPNLEHQMCSWHPTSGMPSPGALDALVIILSDLFSISEFVKGETKPRARPRVR